jgi:hypothetical protein
MVPMCGEIEHMEASKGERCAIAKLSLVRLGDLKGRADAVEAEELSIFVANLVYGSLPRTGNSPCCPKPEARTSSSER